MIVGLAEFTFGVTLVGLIITLLTFMNNSKKAATDQEKRITKLEDTTEHNKVVISDMKAEIKNLEKYSNTVIKLETTMEHLQKSQDEINAKLDRLLGEKF